MLYLLSQATQPTTVPVFPVVPVDIHYPLWVNIVLSILGGIAAVMAAAAIFLPQLRAMIKDLRGAVEKTQGQIVEAKTAAAEAIGGVDALQQSVTRVSNRQNEQAKIVTNVALKVDPNAKPPTEPGPAA